MMARSNDARSNAGPQQRRPAATPVRKKTAATKGSRFCITVLPGMLPVAATMTAATAPSATATATVEATATAAAVEAITATTVEAAA